MRVVPKSARLVQNGELILERMPRRDWTLRDPNRAIRPVAALLINTVPVLDII